MNKMNKNIKVIVLLITLISFLSGCSQRFANFTFLSTKNMAVGQKYVRIATEVTYEDSKPIIVIIPMGMPSLEEAVNRALETSNGDFLSDVVVYYDCFYIPYIYGETKYRVIGNVWKKATNLSEKMEADLKTAKAIYTPQEKNGQWDFLPVSSDSKIVQAVK